MKTKVQDQIYGYLFILPLLIGYLMFTVGPLLGGFALSFTNLSILNKNTSFVGFDNYIKFFESAYSRQVVFNTFFFSTGVVTLNLIIATSLALLLEKKIFGIGFFRLAVFTPILTTVVVWAIVWQLLLSSDGIVNQVLLLFGIKGPVWLFNVNTAMISVVVVATLKGVGMNMFIILAALQNVPEIYYEAASIEGVSNWQKFRYITIPMIGGTLFACGLITVIGSFKSFGLIYVMTKGGPMNSTSVWAYDVYLKAFQSFKIGPASASASVMFLVLVVLTLFQWKSRGKWDYNEN